MSKTVQGLIDFAKSKMGTVYVFGAKGEVLTRAQIQQLQNLYGKSNVWDSDLNKAGKVCVDCSGLISWYTGIIRGSGQYKSTGSQTVPISQRSNVHIGWAVWMQGHIGIYLGNDTYIAADGSAYGVRIAKLSQNRFTHLVKLCDIDYGQGTVLPGSSGSQTAANKTVSTVYAVKTKANGILGDVTDCSDYAGWNDSPITAVMIKCSAGRLKYRVHTKGGSWLGWVYSYNAGWGDLKYGYAGDDKNEIDAIEIYYYTPDDIRPYKRSKYRVAPIGGNYYDWQRDDETSGGQDGYAGVFGKSIGKLQICIED